MEKVLIIGAGITGLAAAWRVQQSSPEASVLVLETSPLSTIRTEKREGFLLEHGPDCFITDKPAALELCRALGLEKDLIGTRPEFRQSFIARDGKLYAVPEGFYLLGPSKYRPFLQSSLISWKGKWRAMLEPLMPKRKSSGDESLGSFVRRRMGQEMLDWFAQPLVAGIYGANPEELSLKATFPRFHDMEEKYGSVILGLQKSASKKAQSAVSSASGPRYSLFMSLRGGLQQLTDALRQSIGSNNIRSNSPVASLEKNEAGWTVKLAGGDVLSADRVILALPAPAAAALLEPIDRELAGDLAAIRYSPAATLNLAFREMDLAPLPKGIGFVVPARENKMVLGCTFVHHKFEGRVPKGFALLRVFIGGAARQEWLNESEESLTKKALAELGAWVGLKGKPLFSQLARYPQALPQYALGHLERVLRIEERALYHKGLALAGNWGRGVGIPDCIASGQKAAATPLSLFRI